MLALEKVYYDLDLVRKRLVRLVEMERLKKSTGEDLISTVLELEEKVNNLLEESDNGNGD